MSDPSSMPAPPPSESYGRPTKGPKPASINTAVNLIWVSVALSVLAAVLSFVYLDEVVSSAAQGAGGTATTESAARVAGIAGIVGGLVIGVVVNVVLAIFLGKGHNWARIVLTIFAVIGIVFGLISLATAAATPVLLLVLQVASLLVTAALLFFLWKKESSAWLKA